MICVLQKTSSQIKFLYQISLFIKSLYMELLRRKLQTNPQLKINSLIQLKPHAISA